MDRLVAVDGQEVDDCNHEQVVDRIRQSGSKCCLLVVDADTDKMYALVSQTHFTPALCEYNLRFQ